MTYLFIITYLSTTKTFYLINSKNLLGEIYATTATTWLLNTDPVNGIENVLLEFFLKMCQQSPFLLQQIMVLIFRINPFSMQEITVFN